MKVPWAKGSRLEFLHENGEMYMRAKETNQKDEFFHTLFEKWFTKYHWSLLNEAEPSPDDVYNDPDISDIAGVEEMVRRRKNMEQVRHT